MHQLLRIDTLHDEAYLTPLPLPLGKELPPLPRAIPVPRPLAMPLARFEDSVAEVLGGPRTVDEVLGVTAGAFLVFLRGVAFKLTELMSPAIMRVASGSGGARAEFPSTDSSASIAPVAWPLRCRF